MKKSDVVRGILEEILIENDGKCLFIKYKPSAEPIDGVIFPSEVVRVKLKDFRKPAILICFDNDDGAKKVGNLNLTIARPLSLRDVIYFFIIPKEIYDHAEKMITEFAGE